MNFTDHPVGKKIVVTRPKKRKTGKDKKTVFSHLDWRRNQLVVAASDHPAPNKKGAPARFGSSAKT